MKVPSENRLKYEARYSVGSNLATSNGNPAFFARTVFVRTVLTTDSEPFPGEH